MDTLAEPAALPSPSSGSVWTDLHGSVHSAAEVALSAALFSLAIGLFHVARRRRDVPFPRLVRGAALWLSLAGASHLLQADLFGDAGARLVAPLELLSAVTAWALALCTLTVLPRVVTRTAGDDALERLSHERMRNRELTRLLQDRREALEQFTRIAAHDLKAPLRAIDYLAQWVHDDSEGGLSAEGEGHLTALRERANVLKAMLDGVFGYVRTESELPAAEEVDLDELAREAVRSLAPRAGARIELAALGTARAPRESVRRVLQQLLANALQHAGSDEPRISVECEREEEQLVVRVRDDGPGIPAGKHEAVFAPFATQGKATAGTGMGLAIVRSLVHAWGGAVRSRDDVAHGACIEFTLPRRPVEVLPGEEAAPAPTVSDEKVLAGVA